MTAVERVLELCKENDIPVSKLERECGFSNAYLARLKKGSLPNDRLQTIADYFGVDPLYISGDSNSKFTDDNAMLVGKMRNDVQLSDALKIYFGLSDAKKRHIIELIHFLGD